MDDNLIQKFGYTEMYEWANVPPGNMRLARFVSFDSNNPEKISLYNGNKHTSILGISTVCSSIESDNPDEWKYAYLCNEFGDVYLKREKLAVGEKVYDQINEITYIKTRPWEHYIRIPSSTFDTNKKYTKRTSRPEWVRVNLLGKVIVEDNGECKPGEYCTPYNGKLKEKYGTAVPATAKSKQKYYVLNRLTDKTITILNK